MKSNQQKAPQYSLHPIVLHIEGHIIFLCIFCRDAISFTKFVGEPLNLVPLSIELLTETNHYFDSKQCNLCLCMYMYALPYRCRSGAAHVGWDRDPT